MKRFADHAVAVADIFILDWCYERVRERVLCVVVVCVRTQLLNIFSVCVKCDFDMTGWGTHWSESCDRHDNECIRWCIHIVTVCMCMNSEQTTVAHYAGRPYWNACSVCSRFESHVFICYMYIYHIGGKMTWHGTNISMQTNESSRIFRLKWVDICEIWWM